MYELKKLSPDAVPAALERAMRYRLLNEPTEAESICRDVLEQDAEHQQALVTLLLALTDQFDQGPAKKVGQARELLSRLESEYERTYYRGIICERSAKARLRKGGPGAGAAAYEGVREAMECYERAEAIRPKGNDESVLRWNTCARLLMQDPTIAPQTPESGEQPLE